MTTQRRPHWDDELLFSVMSAAGDGGHLFIDDIHAVIAAVEDWHKAKRDSRIRTHSEGCWRWHNECAEGLIEAQQRKIQQLANQLLNEVPGSYIQMKARALTAEAAIARVRAVADAWEHYASENGNVRTAWAASSVREALDGDGDA